MATATLPFEMATAALADLIRDGDEAARATARRAIVAICGTPAADVLWMAAVALLDDRNEVDDG